MGCLRDVVEFHKRYVMLSDAVCQLQMAHIDTSLKRALNQIQVILGSCLCDPTGVRPLVLVYPALCFCEQCRKQPGGSRRCYHLTVAKHCKPSDEASSFVAQCMHHTTVGSVPASALKKEQRQVVSHRHHLPDTKPFRPISQASM